MLIQNLGRKGKRKGKRGKGVVYRGKKGVRGEKGYSNKTMF